MIWRSDLPRPPMGTPSAGLSLFETLMALTILALVAGVAAAGMRGPSPALQLRRQAADLTRRVAAARLQAVRDSRTVWIALDGLPCDAEAPPRAGLFAGGTGQAPDLCLTHPDAPTLRLRMDPLTGRLHEVVE